MLSFFWFAEQIHVIEVQITDMIKKEKGKNLTI
jgi:hypothetical protein